MHKSCTAPAVSFIPNACMINKAIICYEKMMVLPNPVTQNKYKVLV